MPKKQSNSGKAIAGLIFLMMIAGSSVIGDEPQGSEGEGEGGEPPTSECSDGIDNDSDGMIDELDPDCDPASPNFNDTESGA